MKFRWFQSLFNKKNRGNIQFNETFYVFLVSPDDSICYVLMFFPTRATCVLRETKLFAQKMYEKRGKKIFWSQFS